MPRDRTVPIGAKLRAKRKALEDSDEEIGM
jgi:hypothetical protein